jgi:hypothetical protein
MELSNAGKRGHAQTNTERVKVYRFRRYSAATGECFSSKTYATQDAIERLDATIIDSSALEVDQAELDLNGCYEPAFCREQILHSHAPKENQKYGVTT